MSVQSLPISVAANISLGLAAVVDLPENAQWERFVAQSPGGLVASGSPIIVKRMGPHIARGPVLYGPNAGLHEEMPDSVHAWCRAIVIREVHPQVPKLISEGNSSR